MRFHCLKNERFRAGTLFTLKPWAALRFHDQEFLALLHRSDDDYGIFMPVMGAMHLTAKLASHATARLFNHFLNEQQLPADLKEREDKTFQKTLACMVLDGILEIRWQDKFVSGIAAAAAICADEGPTEQKPLSVIASLSRQAINYACLLRNLSLVSLSQRLYTSNTIPWDAESRRIFFSTKDLLSFLFSKADTGIKKELEQQWTSVSPTADFQWFSWDKKDRQEASPSTGKNIFKLYISPFSGQLPEVFCKAIPVFTVSKAFSFKICSSKQGFARPDKMVIYFYGKEALFETAALLEPIISHYSVQGVPFTCQLDKTGMLSYGVDPPGENGYFGRTNSSWRMHVTGQLALAILQARREEDSPQKIMRFIEARLYANGISMHDWSALPENEN